MEINFRDVANSCSDQEFEKVHNACKLQLRNANTSNGQAEEILDKWSQDISMHDESIMSRFS